MAQIDHKIRLFRAKFEQDLRKIVTLGCSVSGCVNDGESEVEDEQMNALAKAVMSLAEKSRPRSRRSVGIEASDDGKVTPIRS